MYFDTAKMWYKKVLEIDELNTETHQELQLLARDREREAKESGDIWMKAVQNLSVSGNDGDATSETSTLVESVVKNKTENAESPANFPEQFLKFVKDMLSEFKRSHKKKYKVPNDRCYSRNEMLYMSNEADKAGFDANMEIDDDGSQYLAFYKLKN